MNGLADPPVSRAVPYSRPGEVALEGGQGFEPADLVTRRAALATVLPQRPGVLKAAVYPLARGEAVVRLITTRGWIPVVIGRSDWPDLLSLVARLESALAGLGPPARKGS